MTDKPKSPVGSALRAVSGFSGIECATICGIGDLFADLLIRNWSSIKSCRERLDDATIGISFSFTIDASAPLPKVSGKIGFAQKFTDKAELIVEDPDQEKLPLEGGAK